MANFPSKSKDATEEAISAIQGALNDRAPETRAGTSLGPIGDGDPANPLAPEATVLSPQDASPDGWPAGDTGVRHAANDDRADIGQILQALRRRSSDAA